MKLLICMLAGVLMLPLIAFGQIDSVIIGSVDVDSGSVSAIVPIWVTTADTVETIYWRLCLRSADEDDANFAVDPLVYFPPITEWDMRFDSLMQNGRDLWIVAFAQSDPGPGPDPLFTNNQRWNIITLRIYLNPAMSPRQIIVDSLSAIYFGRDGTVFVPGIINTGLLATDDQVNLPEQVRLSQNYPNPFNAQTTISYNLQQTGPVTLSIYNIMGQKVATLTDGVQQAGEHRVIWNAEGITSGVYFYRIVTDYDDQTARMVLLR